MSVPKEEKKKEQKEKETFDRFLVEANLQICQNIIIFLFLK